MSGEQQQFFDRELSELEYHARVLARAADETLPVLERVKFLAIFSTLTDEFFRVRLAGLKEQRAAGVRSLSRAGRSPREQIDLLHARFRELLAEQRRVFSDEVRPALADAGVVIATWSDLDDGSREGLTAVFEHSIKPILTPLAVGPAHPFPFISDLSLSVGVTLADRPGPGFGRVKVPQSLARFMPAGSSDGEVLVPVEEVIAAHLDGVFPGRDVNTWGSFRVTRNADYDVEDVDIDDLLETVASEVLERRFGRAVRLEVDEDVPEPTLRLLMQELELDPDEVFRQERPLGLGALWELHGLDRPDLKGEPWEPVAREVFRSEDVFGPIRRGDLLVHHPYESFERSTQRFIEQAADDPNVLAIKQTLYRTSGDSPIVHALIRAAEHGKQVAALVELKARFDEEANIRWAEQLEESGVHVVYGFVDLKTHSKTSLVVRSDADGSIRRYGHIATGNYNPHTARSYEDLGLFTADPVLTGDLAELFNMLTTHSRKAEFERLLVAPVNMLDSILELIDREAHDGGRIVAKVNNLTHNEVIRRLYRASDAGAEIDLIVRSICCLRPQVAGLSERIRVRSVVGSFLEHSRILRFGEVTEDRVYLIGSADLMTRNLEHRVEAITPVDDPELQKRLDEILEVCLADTELAWRLARDGTWTQVADGAPPVDAQAELMSKALERE